jgi:hypothetical protein
MKWVDLPTTVTPHAGSRAPRPPVYDYTKILALWADLPDIKIRYTDDETGWAKQLSSQHACLANISTSVELRQYDIVEIEEPDGPAFLPVVGDCLQTYYTETLQIRYPTGKTPGATFKTFQALIPILQAVDGVIEGLFPGFAFANVPPWCDIAALLVTLHGQPGVHASVIHYESDDE